MKLYLVQHGEACNKDIDPERPLTEQGKADVNRLAVFLRKAGVHVDRITHSGKLRAAQTAERLTNAIAPGITVEVNEHLKPNDDPTEFAQLSFTWKNDTLVVGHLPYLAKLVSLLTLHDSRTLFANFTPGSIVCLERTDNKQWLVNWMVRPEVIK
ncbi:MAG: phosphohistidine phosphatase SixA [Granulosicoccaceae bacterium]|jgi:phosphohistidine phosphatase